ncbi:MULTISPECIES: mycofactocin precursor MftA [Protofrankia]|nr:MULTISPECIES: mycofactocin precursor MftA [Protofrankia]ONH35826.1 mycofactocin precursor [Protofrankia sp. BMG5.30]
MGNHAGETLTILDEDTAGAAQAVDGDVDVIQEEFLVEDVSIDGMCGVY